MNHYEMKQQRRRERLENAADRAEQNAERLRESSHAEVAGIPLGQPILVGHHSEARHRRALDRSWNKLGKSIAEGKRAAELRDKAASVGKGGISSDDPDALPKLRKKLEAMQRNQEHMKAVNAAHRAYLKNPASLDKKDLPDHEKQRIRDYVPEYSWEPHPFPPYMLQNNNGNMKRVKDRIKQLEATADQETTEQTIGDVQIVDNAEENRTQVFFPGKPSEAVRSHLKAHGFRWSRYNGCWQRHMSNQATYQAEVAARMHADEHDS